MKLGRGAILYFVCMLPAFAQSLPWWPPTESLNSELPSWVRFSGEERARLEGFDSLGFRSGNDDLYLLNRFRFNLKLLPARWLKVFVQTQDARVFWKSQKPYAPPFQDTWDLRQAYAEVGDSDKSPVALRVGRQEIALGEERLVGPSNWTNTTRTFDAARATLRRGKLRLDIFASSVVVLSDGEVGSVQAGNNLHGLYGGIENVIPGSTIEPYVMWRLQPRVKSELGAVANLDEKISGVRWVGKARALDYGTEMALERGGLGADSIDAWAGHWLLGYTLKNVTGTPRAMIEYNFATGDGHPHDGQRNTFDQLYPSGHDKLGFSDQTGWKNIHHVRGELEWKPLPKLYLSVRHSAYWLADAHDALYNSQGVVLAQQANGSAGRWVGQESDVIGVYSWSKSTQIGAGISHIFPGTFLKRATPGESYTGPYLMFTTQF